jgi:hypothetical protein
VRFRVALAALAVAVVLVPGGQSAGRLTLGVLGGVDRFDQLTGQHSVTRHVIAGWGQSTFAQMFATMRERPMLGLSAGAFGSESINSGAIAAGRGDDYLLALNRAAHEFGRSIFIRPFGEMNGHWNPYCAYNANGTPRDAAHSTRAFRKAFARIYLAVHGDPAIDAKLRRLGMPPFRGRLQRNANAIVVWNPQGYGSPDVPGNSAAAYYPGDAYVDNVGDDLYDIGFRPQWDAAEALYRAHPGKPFSFPEWGLWGIDDPAFVQHMATFLKTHRRTVVAVYYTGRPGSIFDLVSKPRSLAMYRRLVAPLSR